MPTHASTPRPLIGITTDVTELPSARLRLDCSAAYADSITAAGGTPILLSPDLALLDHYLALCHGFLLTGGDDPRTEPFAPHHDPTHPAAKPIHPRRQSFETALLDALQTRRPEAPVLGICLGMQMMALCAGGRLDQHLPETYDLAARHRLDPNPENRRASHPILIDRAAATSTNFPWLTAGNSKEADSHHHQAVADPGHLRIIARSDDGLIEAIAAPANANTTPQRPFYLGIQWHPERTPAEELGPNLFRQLIAAARATMHP